MQRALEVRYRREKDLVPPLVENVEALLTNMQACFDILVPDFRRGLEALDEGPEVIMPSTAIKSGSSGSQQAKAGSGATTSVGANADLESSSEEEDFEWEEADLTGGGGVTQSSQPLLPTTRLGDGSGNSSDEDSDDYDDDYNAIPTWGFGSAQYQIHITLPATTEGLETEDTRPLYDTLREGYGLLSRKYRPTIEQYLKLLGRVQLSSPSDRSICQDLQRSLTGLLARVQSAMEKCDELKVNNQMGRARKRSKQQGLRPDLVDLEAVLHEEGKT